MIGLVVALSSEAKSVIDNIKIEKEYDLCGKKVVEGEFNNEKVVLIISSIGKVNSALSTQYLIDKYSPKYIINFGTCGGVNKSVEKLNYYLANKCAQYDFDLSQLDDVPVGFIQDYNLVFFPANLPINSTFKVTTLASSDRFTCKDEDVKLVNDMGASICDMEGGAIAQVCLTNGVPLYVLKGITDVSGSGTAPEQFYENLKTVCNGFAIQLEKLIAEIKESE